MLGQVTLESRNFHVPTIQSVLLGVQLRIQVSILLLSVDEEVLLVVDFLPQRLNHVNVNFHTAAVVLLHSSFFISYSVEALLQVK